VVELGAAEEDVEVDETPEVDTELLKGAPTEDEEPLVSWTIAVDELLEDCATEEDELLEWTAT
jgi:hypothetical protein